MTARIIIGFAALVLACGILYPVFSNASSAVANAYAPVQAENAGSRFNAIAAYQSAAHVQSSSLSTSYTDNGLSMTESVGSATVQISPTSGRAWTSEVGTGAPLP